MPFLCSFQVGLLALVWSLCLYGYMAQPCPNDCSKRGRCVNPGRTCQCFHGFSGPDCSLFVCPSGPAWVDVASGVDQAHNLAVCSNRGICDPYSGTCQCFGGFEGSACQRISCPGSCGNVGVCLSMSQYANSKDPGYGTVYTYSNIWDANMMFGCKCDPHFTGPDCSLEVCPKGDDPMTGNGVSTPTNPTQVNTIQKVNCRATSGTFTLAFKGLTSKPISYDASASQVTSFLEALPTIGPGGVLISFYNLQACLGSEAYFQVEFLQAFGTLPLLVPDGSGLGANTLLTVSLFQAGTKESEDCSKRGLCDTTSGQCACSTGFVTSNGYNAAGTRGDCGYYSATTALSTCPGDISCSGNGICSGSPTYTCSCAKGWTGADCSQRSCPKGLSWFNYPTTTDNAHNRESECSDMGTCDRTTGVCSCMKNFEGAACELMSCPGVSTPCNSQGRCLDLATLAKLATSNGNSAPTTYGLTPNNPNTWDAKKIRGCYCDVGYAGYDCSLLSCPMGADPNVFGVDEIQILSCTDQLLTGSVVFSFRQQSTIVISATATAKELEEALEAVSTIGPIEVRAISNSVDTLCSVTGSQFSLKFLFAHGDLPLLTYVTTNIDQLSVVASVDGTKQSQECSGRGICDYQLGVCNCMAGYGSSDGMGGVGTIGDCGFIQPLE